MKETARIKLARFVYCLAGWLVPIKTYQRIYEWTGEPKFGDDDENLWVNEGFEYAGRAWLPCRTSIKLIQLAARVDTVHFDHWALEHLGECAGTRCPKCRGHVHPTVLVDLNEEVTSS